VNTFVRDKASIGQVIPSILPTLSGLYGVQSYRYRVSDLTATAYCRGSGKSGMKKLDKKQRAKLDRLQKAIAMEEPKLAAAVAEFNAAVMEAFRKLRSQISEFERVAGEFDEFHYETTWAMTDFFGEQPEEWQEGEKGQTYQDWIDVWDKVTAIPRNFKPPLELTVPEPPLSAAIASLPLDPGEVKKSQDEGPSPASDRPIDPKTSAFVEASWKRIEAWLTKNAPALMAKMGKGASQESIVKAETVLGVEFPDAVRASYAVHDGSGEVSLFPSGDYLSLDEMLGQYKVWKELVEEGSWDDEESEPEGPIQKVHYHLKWIPLTHNGGGDHTLIDLAPAEGGKVGQLIDFSHEMGPECVAATGLAEYLAYLADGLEAGAGVLDETYIEWTRGEKWTRSGYALPSEGPTPGPAVTSGPVKRYFEFTSGTSNKFWEVSQNGSEMTTRYGKIGTNGQSKTKSFATPEKAAAETAKIIATKVKEGYIEKVLSGEASGVADPGGPSQSKATIDWSDLVDPEPMLGKVLPSASDRKRRLFAVACCRSVQEWLLDGFDIAPRDEDYRTALETAERFADGKATAEELSGAYGGADDSLFSNEYLPELTAEERRKACLGDGPDWPSSLMPDEDRREMETHPDPAAWFEESGYGERLPGCVDPYRDVADKDARVVAETVGRQILLLVRHYSDEDEQRRERAAQAALIRDVFGDPFPPPSFDSACRTPDVISLAESIYENKAFDRMPILGDALEEAGCDDPAILSHCRGAGPHVRGCWVLDSVLGKV
jgi:cell wall assembly regulator SMI1/predicted DNA-binding WGR domain protein